MLSLQAKVQGNFIFSSILPFGKNSKQEMRVTFPIFGFYLSLTLVTCSFLEAKYNKKVEENVWPKFVQNVFQVQKGLDKCMLKLMFGAQTQNGIDPILKSMMPFEFR